MSYTEIFYWLTVADNAKTFFGTFAIFFSVVFVLTQLIRIFSHVDGTPDVDFITRLNKWTWYSTPLLLLFLSLWIFTPSKKDALLILAGGTVLDYMANDEQAKEIPTNVFKFVNSSLETWAKEAEVELGVYNEKDKLLDKVKDLSAVELIELIETQPEIKDLILNSK